jgi:hypothetical protein
MEISGKRLRSLLLLMTLPALAQAQFNYTTNIGTITITAYTGGGGAVTIPSTITGLPVTSIGDEAFLGSGLTSVIIPDSVTNIGYGAFSGCYSLASVTMGNGVTSIGEIAFNQCTSLTGITIPDSLASIGVEAFLYCTSLTRVKIGSGVTNIGASAFSHCNSLNGVYFQGNPPDADASVFSDGNSATVYYLPGTTNWGSTFAACPTVLWNPQVQTRDASFGVRTNRFGFNITGTSNLVVVVEACANLANPAWSPVGTNTLTGGSCYFSDLHWTNYPARLYRLRSP